MPLGGWISQADASALVIGTAVIVASLTTIVVAVRKLAQTAPGRWLRSAVVVIGRTLIGDPLARTMHRALDEWAHTPDGPVDRLDRRLASLEEQNVRNGGSTNRDRLNAIGRAVGADPDPVGHPD